MAYAGHGKHEQRKLLSPTILANIMIADREMIDNQVTVFSNANLSRNEDSPNTVADKLQQKDGVYSIERSSIMSTKHEQPLKSVITRTTMVRPEKTKKSTTDQQVCRY